MTGLRALAALLFTIVMARAEAVPMVIDTDAGSDDIIAIALLLSQRNVKIDGITVVNGIAHVDAGARNISQVLGVAGRKDTPVFRGRNRPLRGNAEFPAEWRKISDDLSRTLPPLSRPPVVKPAVDYLVKRLRNSPTPVQILALGPLTNIAEALQRDRSIAAHIREIAIMGGAVRVPGNLQDGGVFHTRNGAAEWNIFIDPFAASIVFTSGVPIRLIALDATNKVHIGPEFLQNVEASFHSPLGRVVAQVLEADRETIEKGIFYAWDPLAAAALLQPNIVKTVAMHIEIKQDPPEEGRTQETPGQANATVAVDANAAGYEALFLASFSETTASP